MPPKKGRPKKKDKDRTKKTASKKEIDEIAEIIGVPPPDSPTDHRAPRDSRNKAPKKKKEKLSYFESKIEYHSDKRHRNSKTNKVHLKAKTISTKLNVYGASKRKLSVPKHIINEEKQLKEEQLKVKEETEVTQEKLAMKIINEMNDPTSVYHKTSFREMVYLKENLNDMNDSEFDCMLNCTSPVWWEQDKNESEEIDDPPPEYASELDEPPPELDCEPSLSISEEMELLQRTETEEIIKKKMSLSNLLNNIKKKSKPTPSIERNLSGVTETGKEVDLVEQSDIIMKSSKPETINSISDTDEMTIYVDEDDSPVESNKKEHDMNFMPTVITVMDDLPYPFDLTEDSNPSNDTFLVSGENSHAIDPEQLTYSVVIENNVIEDLCDDNTVEEKDMNKELCKEKDNGEKELNFLSDFCKLKRKHNESDRKENEVTQSKKPCVMTYDFSKSKPVTFIDSDEECPKFIVSNCAFNGHESNKDDFKKTDGTIDSKKEEESRRNQLLKDLEMKKAREIQNIILKHKKYKQLKEEHGFGSKDVIIEKYASKLNEQLSRKSKNITFSANNDVRYIQALHELNKDDQKPDIEKIDK